MILWFHGKFQIFTLTMEVKCFSIFYYFIIKVIVQQKKIGEYRSILIDTDDTDDMYT